MTWDEEDEEPEEIYEVGYIFEPDLRPEGRQSGARMRLQGEASAASDHGS
jgi:hypothetical protein